MWSRLCLGLALVACVARAESLPDFTELVEKQSSAVVNISTTQAQKPGNPNDEGMQEFFKRYGIPAPGTPAPKGNEGGEDAHSLGSGFIISEDGYVLTNAHVVEDAAEITVTLTDKRKLTARIIGSDRKTDVALIKIEANHLKPVVMGDVNKLKVGEWVVAIGSPFGFESTVTKGIVSAKGRSLPQETLVPFIQTDVPINPGNSGGPLFNMKGEVVGINAQIYSRTGGFMGLSFAIPIDVALDVASQLRTSGRVSRGWLGVVIQDVTPEIAESFGLPKAEGALVAKVDKGTPGEKGGLEQSDVITSFNGKLVLSREDLPRYVSATKPGTTVALAVIRKGETRRLEITVGEMPQDAPDSLKPASRKSRGDSPAAKLGLTISSLKEEARNDLGIKGGVLVEEAAGAAGKAGLQAGDVVLSVNNMDVNSVEEFNAALTKMADRKSVALLVRRGESSRFVTLKKDPNAG